eukprot:2271368-Pleurochrysis_carterae.AAC.2
MQVKLVQRGAQRQIRGGARIHDGIRAALPSPTCVAFRCALLLSVFAMMMTLTPGRKHLVLPTAWP